MLFPKGLFCHNFGACRGVWGDCKGVWCGTYYHDKGSVEFHIAWLMNDEGVVWKQTRDKDRFLVGREGDMLMPPFQCDRCWFVNLKRSLPVEGKLGDENLLTYIRRVNLDILWSRSPSTVNTNKGNFSKTLRMCHSL